MLLLHLMLILVLLMMVLLGVIRLFDLRLDSVTRGEVKWLEAAPLPENLT